MTWRRGVGGLRRLRPYAYPHRLIDKPLFIQVYQSLFCQAKPPKNFPGKILITLYQS